MNKLLYKVLFTITTVFTFSNSTIVISMDHTINKSDKNLTIPHKKELVNELNLFCDSVQEYVKKYTNKENEYDNNLYDLETQMAANAAEKEFELNGKTGKNCEWGVCPDYMQGIDIPLNNYIEKMSEVYDKGGEGVCRHLASSLFNKLHSKGFFCGIMFCYSGNHTGGIRIPRPNHVVTLIALKDSDTIQFFVSDPRNLQIVFCNNYRYMQNPELKKIQNHSDNVCYHLNKDEFLKQISRPIDVLLIPLDKYLKFKDICEESISVAFDLKSKLNFKKDSVWYPYPVNIGNKTVNDFKKQAEIFFKSTISGNQIS